MVRVDRNRIDRGRLREALRGDRLGEAGFGNAAASGGRQQQAGTCACHRRRDACGSGHRRKVAPPSEIQRDRLDTCPTSIRWRSGWRGPRGWSARTGTSPSTARSLSRFPDCGPGCPRRTGLGDLTQWAPPGPRRCAGACAPPAAWFASSHRVRGLPRALRCPGSIRDGWSERATRRGR